MEVIHWQNAACLFKNIKQKISSSFLLCIAIAYALFSINGLLATNFVGINASLSGAIAWNFMPQPTTKDFPCPSVAYLQKPDLQDILSSNGGIHQEITRVGPELVATLLNQILSTETMYVQKNYSVFYHGQQREFMLLQDLVSQLYQLLYKKPINKFFFLRMFDPDFGKYKNAQQYLADHRYYINDDYEAEKKALLSVNPWLFGNITHGGECTFSCFLESYNMSSCNFDALFKGIFVNFKIEQFFAKYQADLQALLQLLAQTETKKTGLLMQIFIPNTIVDDIAYRAIPWGSPYYNPSMTTVAARQELPTYAHQSFITNTPFHDLDAIQYRILFTEKHMLDPTSDIIIYRYINDQTDNMIKYKKDFAALINNIKKDLHAAGTI